MKLGNGKTDQGFVAAKNAPWNEILTSLLCEGNNYKKSLRETAEGENIRGRLSPQCT